MAREPAALLVIEGRRLDTSGQFLKGNVDEYLRVSAAVRRQQPQDPVTAMRARRSPCVTVIRP